MYLSCWVRRVEDLSIDIAYYIQQIQIQTTATIKEGKLLDEDRINILIRGAMTTAKALEVEIYRSKTNRE